MARMLQYIFLIKQFDVNQFMDLTLVGSTFVTLDLVPEVMSSNSNRHAS